MTRRAVFEYVRQNYGVTPEYPWNDCSAVLRHRENRKWFGLIMEISRGKLGFPDDTPIDVLNVKCDPVLVGVLLAKPGFHRAYHMNKEKWVTIRLDGSVGAAEVKELLDYSYALTMPKSTTRRTAKDNTFCQ